MRHWPEALREGRFSTLQAVLMFAASAAGNLVFYILAALVWVKWLKPVWHYLFG